MTQLFIILFAYFVQFTDKMGSNRVALSDIALEKRTTRGIAIDSLDYAVSPIYIDSLRQTGSRIYHTSRWMNGATIETDSNTIQRIAQWSFVDTIYVTRREAKGERQEVKGERREAKGERREAKGERRKARGERRKAKGERRKARGERRKARGERREARGERREAKGERRKAGIIIKIRICDLLQVSSLC